MGAPAAFPVAEGHRHLHKYVRWSDEIVEEATQFVEREFPQGGPIVAIHLRNGYDWVNKRGNHVCVSLIFIYSSSQEKACTHVDGERNFMASPQCLGYAAGGDGVTGELCLPSKGEVLRRVKEAVVSLNAEGVFVATDRDPMIGELTQHLGDNVRKPCPCSSLRQ